MAGWGSGIGMGWACSCATEEEQDAARAAMQALEREIEAHGLRAGALNRAFHITLARPARRPITLQVLERLHVLSDRYVREHLAPPGRDIRAETEHDLLFERWKSRDHDEVVRMSAAHIETTLQDLRRQLAPEV